MNKTVIYLASFLLMCFTLWHTLAQAGHSYRITIAETLLIEGNGYSPPPYEADDAGLIGAWQQVDLPHSLPRPLIHNVQKKASSEVKTVVTWFRLTVPIFTLPIKAQYIYIPRWKTDGKIAVYADKRLVFQSHSSMLWNGWNRPLWIPLALPPDADFPHKIIIRIERPQQSGGGISSVWMGDHDGLNWRYTIRNFVQVQLPNASGSAFLAVGIFSLFVWLRLKAEKEYLLFFFISMASFLRTLHFFVGEHELAISDDWFTWITINSLFWMVLITHFFLNYLHQKPIYTVNRVVIGISVLVAFVTFPGFHFLPDAYTLSPLVYIALILLGSTVAVSGYFKSYQSSSRDGLLLSTWALVGMLIGGYDWLMQNNHINIENIYMGPFSNIAAFIIFMHIVFRRYVAANAEVKKVNSSLQLKLNEQEIALLESHHRLREIAHRQTLSDERQRLMQDMHDGMGSSLRTALFAIERGQISHLMVADVLKDCIDDLKLTIDSLEPVQSDLLILLATLRFRLGPRLESAGVSLRWEIENVPALDWIDPTNALHILRILQESFTNIIKHTNATEIRVITIVEKDFVVVKIIDNGAGFLEKNKPSSTGKGLVNQIRRAESIGAKITWLSSNTGTSVSLCLPIKSICKPILNL